MNKYVSFPKAQRILGLTYRELHEHAKSGLIEYEETGGVMYFTNEQLEAYIDRTNKS